MKGCLFALVLVCCALITQAQTVNNFYVSPSGSDANPGTAVLPWATFQKAVDMANPGDVINILPGTYSPAAVASGVDITRSGTRAAPITLRGYGGRPVLNCSKLTLNNDSYCFDLRANWWIIKDIDVTLAQQFGNGYVGIGVLLFQASNNVIDHVRSYANEGAGFALGYSSVSANNLFRNCDAYNNYDPLTSPNPGDNASGFQTNAAAGSTGNVFDRCRAWNNSNDGFDLWETEEPVTIRHCWSFGNGIFASGTGTGFKLGRNDSGPSHVIHNNLAFNNVFFGFTSNSASPGAVKLFNNLAYGNGSSGITVFPGNNPYIMRNNISAQNGDADWFESPNIVDDTFNSWNLAVTVTAADFLSVAAALASAPRNADGSLPVNDLFRLAATSDLIDKGVNVGLPYSGGAPDLGAYEFGGTPPAAPKGLRVVK